MEGKEVLNPGVECQNQMYYNKKEYSFGRIGLLSEFDKT